MPAGSLKKLFVRIGADTEGFQNAMDGMQSKMANAGQAVSNAGGKMTKWVTGPIAGAGSALVGLAKKTGDYADHVLDLAAATGHSTETIQEFEAVADRAGTSTEAFTNASQKLTKQMTRGEDGSAALKRALDDLGLSFDELEEASPDERMQTVIRRLQDIEDEGERAQVGTQLLRNGYEELAPVLDMTSEEMDDVIEGAHESGRVMDEEGLESADKFRKSLDELKQEFIGLGRSIAEEVMPILNDKLMPIVKDELVPILRSFAERIAGIIEWYAELDPALQKFIAGIIALAAALGPVLIIVGKIITALSTILPIIKAVGAIIAGVASGPVLILIGVIAALVAAIIYFREEIWAAITFVAEKAFGLLKSAAQGLKDFFTGIVDGILGVFETLWDGIKSIINFIIGGINSMIKAINTISVDVPDWVPGNIESFGFDIPTIPKLAKGGNINLSGAALVGEEGPELVDLPSGAGVRPIDGEGSARKIDMNITQHISDKATAEHANDDLLRKLQGRGLGGAYR